MIYYLKGKVAFMCNDSIVLDVNNVGFHVFVSRVSNFEINDEVFLYIHEVYREDNRYLVGFLTEEEKGIFLSLIKVKGLGPKTAIKALSYGNPNELIDAIISNNIAYLKRLPGIGSKAALQILLDLKKEFSEPKSANSDMYKEVQAALKEMGFKNKIINEVLKDIGSEFSSREELLKAALIEINRMKKEE